MTLHRIALLLFLSACTAEMAEPLDEVDLDEEVDLDSEKADRACAFAGETTARGVLALVNDPSVTADELDARAPDGVGLDRRSSQAIVAARPLASVADLARVPFVGTRACLALERAACDRRGLCEAPLDLMTWNLEAYPKHRDTPAEVASIVVELMPDVIGFQEIPPEAAAFEALVASFPGYRSERARSGYYNGVALAYRPDRLEVVETESLFVDDDWAFPRPPLAVTFSVIGRAGSDLLTVIVVHLKAQVDERSESRRRLAIERLSTFIAMHRTRVTEHVVVLGDFNDKVTDAPADDVFAAFRGGDFAFVTEPIAAARGFSYIPFHTLIDHIVATDRAAERFAIETVDVVQAETMVDDYVERVSDHRPVRSRHVPILPRQ